MAATSIPNPCTPRSFWRFWFPLLVLGIAALILGLLHGLSAEYVAYSARGMGTVMTTLSAALALSVWLLFLSGLRWWHSAGALLLAGTACLAAVREVKLTGDWMPLLVYRWDASGGTLREPTALAVAALQPVRPVDSPTFRGPAGDGVFQGPALSRDWESQPPRALWHQAVGGGYSSFAVVGDCAITLEQRGDEEAVVCYDTASGQVRWLHSYPAHFKEVQGGNGPRATPTIADGDVYSLGATGHLVCLDGRTGKEKWSVEILAGNDNLHWGMSGSPLVYDQVVVVNPGVQKKGADSGALVAYDRATGRRVWTAGATRAGYSSPMLATLAGKRQILLFDGEQIGGYDPAGGRLLWNFPWSTMQGINVAQPLVLDGNRVFISSGYGVGGAMLSVTETGGAFTVKQLWKTPALKCKFCSPVVRNGYLYGLDDGVLVCLDARTGKRAWKGGRYGHGQLLLTDDLLVVLSEEGELVLVEANPKEPHELGRVAALTAKTRTWNYPALADGKAYLRNDVEMTCYDLRAKP